jgi:elongation factor G
MPEDASLAALLQDKLTTERSASSPGTSSLALSVSASSLAVRVGVGLVGRAMRQTRMRMKSSMRARRGVGLLLDALVTYLPSPAERPPAFGLDPRRDVTVARFARDEDALAAVVFATTDDPRLGQLTWLRIYSGTLLPGLPVIVLPRDERGAVERIYLPVPSGLAETEDAGPGAVVCVSGLSNAHPGDTVASIRAPVVLDETRVSLQGSPSRGVPSAIE